MTEVETCWRCATPMVWVQSTWQCPKCKWKLGCCEGEPQSLGCTESERESGTEPQHGLHVTRHRAR
jgi:hypothetical protein